MANRERGELRLVARHRSYVLRLTVSAVCTLEDRTDSTLGEIITRINAGSATDLRWLFWAALQDRHAAEAETLEDAGTIGTNAGGIDGIMSALGRLIHVNEDDSRDDQTNEPADAPPEPGSRWRRLYIDARVAGLSPEQFWGLSLRELWLERAAQRERDRDDLKRDKVLVQPSALEYIEVEYLKSLDGWPMGARVHNIYSRSYDDPTVFRFVKCVAADWFANRRP